MHTYIHTECTYLQTHTHTYRHTHTHTYIHTYIHTYMHTHIPTYTHTNIHTHTRIHTYIHTLIHMFRNKIYTYLDLCLTYKKRFLNKFCPLLTAEHMCNVPAKLRLLSSGDSRHTRNAAKAWNARYGHCVHRTSLNQPSGGSFVRNNVGWSVKLRSHLDLVFIFRTAGIFYPRFIYTFAEMCLQQPQHYNTTHIYRTHTMHSPSVCLC